MLKNPAYMGKAAFGKTKVGKKYPILDLNVIVRKTILHTRLIILKKRNGLVLMFPLLSVRIYLMWYKSNWKKIERSHVKEKEEHDIYYKAFSFVVIVVMLIMARKPVTRE